MLAPIILWFYFSPINGITDKQGMVWNGMEDDFSIFHTGNFLLFYFHSILKIFHSIFHSILNFSSIFHSILQYQGKFRPEATRNLYHIFATFSVLLQKVTHEGKQYGTMHLIPYLKRFHNDLLYTIKIQSAYC